MPAVWRWALALLAIAAWTGVGYRFFLSSGSSFGLDLLNVRHAHSHLMYFGWVTPAVMLLVSHRLMRRNHLKTQTPPSWIFAAIIPASILAYVSFLLYGYGPAAFGDAELPLSMIISGIHIIFWYAYAIWFFVRVGALGPHPAPVFWTSGAILLVVSTLGAWGLAVSTLLFDPSESAATAMTHVFLDLFSEGWLVLSVLGLAWDDLKPRITHWPRWTAWLLIAGIPATVALGMPAAMVSDEFAVFGRIGGVAVAVGLLVNLYHLLPEVRTRSAGLWRAALGLLLLKALLMLAASLLPADIRIMTASARVFYLHVMLLGVVTIGLVASARNFWGDGAVRGSRLLPAVVLLLLLFLIPLTNLFPSGLRGAWILPAAAWASVPAAIVLTVMAFSRHRTEIAKPIDPADKLLQK